MSPFDTPVVAPLVFPLALPESSTKMSLSKALITSKSNGKSYTLVFADYRSPAPPFSLRAAPKGRRFRYAVDWTLQCDVEDIMIGVCKGSCAIPIKKRVKSRE